jgi:hypothetical protein
MGTNTMIERPSKVTAAVVMLYVVLGIATAEWLIGLSRAGQSLGLPEYLTVLTLGPVFFWFIYVIGQGKDWARIAVLVIVAPFLPFSAISLARSLAQTPLSISLDVGIIILDAVALILEIGALIFLFQKDSSAWFKAMKDFQPLPFRGDEETTTASWPGQKDLANLVTRIKTELAGETRQGTVVGRLVKNGWDRREADQFVQQIAYELRTNPKDVQLLVKRYQKYMLYGAVVAAIGLAAILCGLGRSESLAAHVLVVGVLPFLWGVVGWLVYRGRLNPNNPRHVNRSITFRPSKGSLDFTK